jgi:Na+-translocating ferredoxin:NAD+ oxidoreductase subunit B
MSGVYERLAKKLDDIPNGFPATESGVEIRILKKIFSVEEAEMALKLNPVPETAETIAERLDKPVSEMRSILDGMAGKGQIACPKISGQRMYILAPFMIGFYALQVYRLDKELADLFEEYFPAFLKKVGAFEPPYTRVVPVNAKIDAELSVHLYEDIHRMINEAKSFKLHDCICRKTRVLRGHSCKHTLESCLAISQEERAFENLSLGGRVITKEEALEALSEFEKDGLVHLTWNVQQMHSFICNCCPCCCDSLRAVKEFNVPCMMVKSNFISQINRETCTGCGICKDERCPMEAIQEDGGSYEVLPDRCIGCGVCSITCPADSITMKTRPELIGKEPPVNIMDWRAKRAASRGVGAK